MKLELNTKEYLSLFGLLERNRLQEIDDRNLIEVYLRMRSTLLSILNDAQKNKFEQWAGAMSEKIQNLQSSQEGESGVLTIDDVEESKG